MCLRREAPEERSGACTAKLRRSEVVPGVGVARASDARRRSHPRWAPPRLNFLLKIQVPAFDSSRSAITKKGHLAMPVFVIVPGVGVEPT